MRHTSGLVRVTVARIAALRISVGTELAPEMARRIPGNRHA